MLNAEKCVRGFTWVVQVSMAPAGLTQAMPIWQMLATALRAVSTSSATKR